jgi:YD repeat-containing protein
VTAGALLQFLLELIRKSFCFSLVHESRPLASMVTSNGQIAFGFGRSGDSQPIHVSAYLNVTSASKPITVSEFTYDNAGNRISVVEATKDRVTWTYDSTYHLTQEQRSGVDGYQTTYVYDSNGNRLVKNADGSITTSTFDGADQLIDSVDSTGTTSYSFDADGNLSLAEVVTNCRTLQVLSLSTKLRAKECSDGWKIEWQGFGPQKTTSS